MTTDTLTIAEFLLARVAEDETVARSVDQGIVDGIEEFHEILGWRDALVIDASRVLAQCAAIRAVVELEPSNRTCGEVHPTMDMYHPDGHGPSPVLRALAQPYADHPQFRPEWRA